MLSEILSWVITMTTSLLRTHTVAIWYLINTMLEIHTHKYPTLHTRPFMAQQAQWDQWAHKEKEDLRDIREL